MKKGFLKKALLVLIPIVVLAVMAMFDPNVADIGDVLKQVDSWWFLAAVMSIFVYYYMDTLMYQLACRYMRHPQKLGESLITTMLGFFYSALTPFSTGGQPLQVLQMRRRGIKVGVSTCVLTLKFIAWQLAVTVLGIIGLIFLSAEMFSNNLTMMITFIIGFLFYIGTVAIGLLILLKPDWVERVGKRVLGFLASRRILKKTHTAERANETWQRFIKDFRVAIDFAMKHKGGMLLIFFVCCLEVLAYMSVTYFIYRGLGFNAYGYFYVLLLQGFLHIAVSFMPLPGASIASEGGFYIVFAQLFSPAARFPAVVLWRVICYYSSLLLGLVAVVIDGVRTPVSNGDDDDTGNDSGSPDEDAQSTSIQDDDAGERIDTPIRSDYGDQPA